MNWQNRLISARHLIVLITIVLAALLLNSGRHAEYEQSIKSFFAEDDPAILQFEKWADVFGYDNILFVCYDDPDYLTPAGMTRLEALTKKLQDANLEGVQGIQSLATIPPVWLLDDSLEQMNKMPATLRNFAMNAAKKLAGNVPAGGGSGGLTVASTIKSASPAQLPGIADKIRSGC